MITCDISAVRLRSSLRSFFHFMRRFWNLNLLISAITNRNLKTYQILTWRSVRPTLLATSSRLSRLRYWLKWNSFSSSRSWNFVYGTRFFLPSKGFRIISLMFQPYKSVKILFLIQFFTLTFETVSKPSPAAVSQFLVGSNSGSKSIFGFWF